MTKSDRANFGSKLGVILASAGSAVGLGNIWRFPFETGNHGGAAFILVYLVCVLILGIPIMIAEFLIGRRSRANTARAYQKLAPGTHWRWVGRMGVLAGFLILGYYSVVAGWTLEFIGEAATNSFAGKSAADFIASFNSFVSNPWRPVIWLVLFLLATHLIIVKGVEKGIEKSAKIMMPMLFVLLIILAICSISLPGAGAGIEFLLKPDFSKVDGNVFLGAMGQAFFSLSLGMGCLCTCASYFRNDTNLPKTALNVAAIDTMVAILAGFIIFPAAFSVGIKPDAGPSLLFITLPNVFQQAFGNIPWLAILLSLMFYILLALAALTSTISLHEVVTAYLHEEFKFSRSKAARYVYSGLYFLRSILLTVSRYRQKLYRIRAKPIRFVRLCNGQANATVRRFLHFHLHRLVSGQENRMGRSQQQWHSESIRLQAIDIHPEIYCSDRNCTDFYQ